MEAYKHAWQAGILRLEKMKGEGRVGGGGGEGGSLETKEIGGGSTSISEISHTALKANLLKFKLDVFCFERCYPRNHLNHAS